MITFMSVKYATPKNLCPLVLKYITDTVLILQMERDNSGLYSCWTAPTYRFVVWQGKLEIEEKTWGPSPSQSPYFSTKYHCSCLALYVYTLLICLPWTHQILRSGDWVFEMTAGIPATNWTHFFIKLRFVPKLLENSGNTIAKFKYCNLVYSWKAREMVEFLQPTSQNQKKS